MNVSKNGLRVVDKAGLGDGEPIERPPMDFPSKVVMAILYLLLALYASLLVTDLVEGRESPLLDNGAPRPCAPPSQGIWPDCHESGQK